MAASACVCFCVLLKSRAGTCYTFLAWNSALFQLCWEVFNSNQGLKFYTHKTGNQHRECKWATQGLSFINDSSCVIQISQLTWLHLVLFSGFGSVHARRSSWNKAKQISHELLMQVKSALTESFAVTLQWGGNIFVSLSFFSNDCLFSETWVVIKHALVVEDSCINKWILWINYRFNRKHPFRTTFYKTKPHYRQLLKHKSFWIKAKKVNLL